MEPRVVLLCAMNSQVLTLGCFQQRSEFLTYTVVYDPILLIYESQIQSRAASGKPKLPMEPLNKNIDSQYRGEALPAAL